MPLVRLLALVLLTSCTLPLSAAEPTPETARGRRMIEAYVRDQTKQIADACLTNLTTRADWERQRPELRRQFFEMMGLWPLPGRTDLHSRITGKVEASNFTVEKLDFQSLPGLYVTANLYVPKGLKAPAPAIVYLCGHSRVQVDKVDYGNKVAYQQHAIWYAQNGYVCLVLDTLQLGEIPGIHHGTHNLGQWWWHSFGYTPAGVECWNSMRALDYLETRKEVDPKRFGVAGRSGGGAGSWWLAAADDRVQAIVPVAGIADLQAHLVEGSPRYPNGVIPGHCDCMYFVNTYRWDFPMVAALCAPRPLLLGNSDADEIFPVPGYRRLAEKVRKVYGLYGAADHFALLETKGPHKDTPELRQGEYAWMNRWLKNDRSEVKDSEWPRYEPQQLKVLDKLPDDAVNPRIQETFVKTAPIEIPHSAEVAREWWKGENKELMTGLREKVFRGWPAMPPELNLRAAADLRHDGVRLRAYDFVSEQGIELRFWLLNAEKVEKPTTVVLSALDEAGWHDWLAELGPAFRNALQVSGEIKQEPAKFAQLRQTLETQKQAQVVLAPRGVGPTRWADANTPDDVHLRRRFALLGETLDSQRVWDVRRTIHAVHELDEVKGAPLWLQGKGEMAGIMLYAAIFEPDVARLDLEMLPISHKQGPQFLNVLRFLDLPQAVALVFPRPVYLHVKDEATAKAWAWPLQLQRELGQDSLKIQRKTN